MGWQDRRYEDHEESFGGRLSRAMRRIFIEGDGFWSWSVPVFKAFGISVRLHLLFLIYIIAELVRAADPQADGFLFAAYRLAALFGLVLLHEFGHCFACRRVGGEADQIMLWPLGGLAYCRTPHNWKANLITTLGGPGVNLVLIPIIGGVLLALGAGWRTVIYNPITHNVYATAWYAYEPAYWKILLLYLYNINLALFLFNMLLVMFPMDAGRVLQELLWWRMGYRRATIIATSIGLALAIIIGAASLIFMPYDKILVSICIMCGLTCYQTRRQAMMFEDETYDVGSPATYGYGPRAPEQPTRASKRTEDKAFAAAARKQQQEKDDQAELDRILAKISETGMQSLSRLERKRLEDASRRRRGE